MVDQLITERRKEEWRETLRKSVKTKDRMDATRVVMPALDGNYRNKNNEEVNQGLSPEAAQAEAVRCLDCANLLVWRVVL